MAITTSSGAAAWNFTLRQGSEFNPVMTMTDDNGRPMDFTGWSMTMNIARGVNMTPLLTINSSASSGSRIILGGADGTIQIIITGADTASLESYGLPMAASLMQYPVTKLGLHELVFVAADGTPGCLFEGIVNLEQKVPA
ncbi:hypothetical protein KDW10_22565 [Burkholderia vietnamiensis]|uniref:hypothetical protein n=1 Tax=Burkholderia vietnamiensis TaxID=60552 RepID=UPI001BA179F2|nr:hypothetical protein [Burkholderia vietnamiensis]MBR8360121.1 hypothetical protein [Burkholderia vietnamiensis]